MATERPPSDVTERELAALADGSLSGEARASVERRVAASPRLRALLAEQRRATEAVRTISEAAPAALRMRVERPARLRPRPRWRPLAIAVPAAAGVAVATLVVALAGGGESAPSVASVAGLGTRVATSSPPPPSSAQPNVLALRSADVPYPNLQARYGWRATGERVDAVAGRHATTIFYSKGAQLISYTIVSGAPLRPPPHAGVRVQEGTRLIAFSAQGRTTVTWERRGHTCVLSGSGTPAATLADLAAWRGGGSIPF